MNRKGSTFRKGMLVFRLQVQQTMRSIMTFFSLPVFPIWWWLSCVSLFIINFSYHHHHLRQRMSAHTAIRWLEENLSSTVNRSARHQATCWSAWWSFKTKKKERERSNDRSWLFFDYFSFVLNLPFLCTLWSSLWGSWFGVFYRFSFRLFRRLYSTFTVTIWWWWWYGLSNS